MATGPWPCEAMTTILDSPIALPIGVGKAKIEKMGSANPFAHLLRLITIAAIGFTPFTEIVHEA